MRRVVVVTGPPASGKTTIASQVARDFALPLVAKDGFKETLFETLGIGDLDWSRRLGVASFALIRHVLELELAAGRAVVIEGNFDAVYCSSELRVILDRFGPSSLQLFSHAPVDVLFARYANRQRHPGHADADRLEEIRERLLSDQYRLELAGATVLVDTTTDERVNYDAIRAAVAEFLRA